MCRAPPEALNRERVEDPVAGSHLRHRASAVSSHPARTQESEGARALNAYDRWLAIQLDETARTELKSLCHDTRRDSALFQEITEIGRQFERAVLALLFNTRLAPLSQQYVVF